MRTSASVEVPSFLKRRSTSNVGLEFDGSGGGRSVDELRRKMISYFFLFLDHSDAGDGLAESRHLKQKFILSTKFENLVHDWDFLKRHH